MEKETAKTQPTQRQESNLKGKWKASDSSHRRSVDSSISAHLLARASAAIRPPHSADTQLLVYLFQLIQSATYSFCQSISKQNPD